MTTIDYLMDENVDMDLIRALRRRMPGGMVPRVGDPGAPPLRGSDLEILRWCEENAFTLVTNNRASMPVHLREHLQAGRHIPGIFILDDDMPMGETIEELALIAGASDAEEYIDLIRHLPITRKCRNGAPRRGAPFR